MSLKFLISHIWLNSVFSVYLQDCCDLLNIFEQFINKIWNEDFIKAILDKWIKFSEDVGIGIFSYHAKLY